MEKKEIVGIGIIVSAFLLLISVVMAVPPVPYPLVGYVKIAETGEGCEGTQIIITNLRTGIIQIIQTHTNGAYSTDAGNPQGKNEYKDGDVIKYEIKHKIYRNTTTHKIDKEKGFNTMVIWLTKDGEKSIITSEMEKRAFDSDGDGYSNKEELLAKTDPNDPYSYPIVKTQVSETQVPGFECLNLYIVLTILVLIRRKRNEK